MSTLAPSRVERPAFHLGRPLEASCGAGGQPLPTRGHHFQEVCHGSTSVRRSGRVAGVAGGVGVAGHRSRPVLPRARVGHRFGGARGADQFALEAVVAAGAEACRSSVVFLPGAHAAAPGRALGAFAARGGRVVPGSGAGRTALLGRSRRLAQASSGVVAFLWGPSRGSVFTVREAIRSGRPAAVVLAGGGAALPLFTGGAWVACTLGGVAAFRWVPSLED